MCVCVFSKRQRKSRQAEIVSETPTCQPVTTAVKFGTLTMTCVQEQLPSTDNTAQGRVSPTGRKKKKKNRRRKKQTSMHCVSLTSYRGTGLRVCLRCPGKARGNCYEVKGTTRLCDVQGSGAESGL